MPVLSIIKNVMAEADAVIHFGAGKCRELSFYQEADSRIQFLLVEAHPGMARELAARVHANRNIRVKPFAVAASSGEGTLHCYNLPDCNSLREATGLQELFPGLREIETKAVQCRTPAQFLAALELAEKDTACLVIDTPGEELAILQSLANENELSRCNQLVLRCGKQPLYKGAASERDILNFLEQQGFETVSTDTNTDPDQPVHLLSFNRWKAECDRLIEAMNALKAELDSTKKQHSKQLEALRQQHEKLLAEERGNLSRAQNQYSAELDEQRAEMESERQAALAHKTKQIQALIDERDTLANEIDKLKEAGRESESRIGNLQAEIAAARKQYSTELDEQRAEMESARQAALAHKTRQIQALADERDKLANEIDELKEAGAESESRIGKLQAEIEVAGKQLEDARKRSDEAHNEYKLTLEGLRKEHAEEVSRLQEESAKLLKEMEKKDEDMRQFRSDLSVALRMQTMRENDLKDLQERYASLLDIRQRQDDLLRKLQQRLTIASDCLKQLKVESGEDSEGRLTRNLIDALSGAEGE